MASKLPCIGISVGSLGFGVKSGAPRRANNVIRRQRLIDLLHRNIDSRIQVVSAPAGYGKTTLLVDFINDLDIPVCWYSLDESDRDPRIFIEGLSISVRSQFPDFYHQSDTPLLPTFELEKYTAKLVDAFVNELAAKVSEYTIFVIEDYHFIGDSGLLKTAFDLLLNNMPNNCHLIISSRSSIELPALSKLVVQRKANYLGISDISFTPTETKNLLATYCNINLTDPEIEKLVSETGGWLIGIILKANKIRDYAHTIDNHTPLSNENVFDFLSSEVYEKLTPEIQEFLLTSGILDIIDPDICDHLLGTENSQRLLHNITRHQLFIQCIDSEKPCYRYHHIFREFLRQKLLEEDQHRFRILHFKAAILYEKAQQYINAVQHFITAKEYDGVSRIINNVGEELLDTGKWATLLSWINTLPKELYSADQRIMMLYARSLVYAGESSVAIGILNSLLDSIQGGNDWLFEARIISWRSAAYRLTGYLTEAQKDIKTSISILKKNKGPLLDTGDAYRRLGNILKEQGLFKKALRQLQRSLKYYTMIMNVSRLAEVHNSIGIIYKNLGDLDTASMHFEKSRIGWQKIGNDGSLSMTLTNIAQIYHRRGEYELALDTLQLGLDKARQAGYRRIESYTQIHTAEVKRSQGLYEDAIAACNQGLELARQVMETRCVAWAKADMAENYRLLGDLDKAETLIKEAVIFANEHGHHCDAVQFKIQIGIIEYERGNYSVAMQTLGEVVGCLKIMEDKYALAKAILHLAQALFMSRDYDQALFYLKNLANLCNEIGYYDFITVEGRNCRPLLQFGISKGIGDENFSRAVGKIRLFHNKVREWSAKDIDKGSYVAKADIEVRALGEVKVITYGLISETQWRSNKAKELFYYLLHAKKGCTSEQIATALWPDLSPAKAIGNFHVNLYRARRAVLPNLFSLEDGKYKISRDLRIWFDVTEFENKLQIAFDPKCENELKIASLEQAIELYRGDFMDGFFSEWVYGYRRELEDRYVRALSVLAKIKDDNGEYDSSIDLMLKAIRVNQFNEEAYCKIIEWQMIKGDRTSAITTYHRYLDQIVREMDISPSPKMQNLHQRVFSEDDRFRYKV